MATHDRCCRDRLCAALVVDGKKRSDAEPSGDSARGGEGMGLGASGEEGAVTIGVEMEVRGDVSRRPAA